MHVGHVGLCQAVVDPIWCHKLRKCVSTGSRHCKIKSKRVVIPDREHLALTSYISTTEAFVCVCHVHISKAETLLCFIFLCLLV